MLYATTRVPTATHLIDQSTNPCHLLSVRTSSGNASQLGNVVPSVMMGLYGGVGVAEGI